MDIMDIKDINDKNIEKILVGKVLKPQGIKGEVKVLPHTEPETVEAVKAVYICGAGEPVAVERCDVRGGSAYMLLAGVVTRNDAEALRGKELYAVKPAVKLKKGAYFIKDIIGSGLWDSEGAFLGTVAQVDNYGSADVYTVSAGDGRVLRFPFIKALKPKVDVQNKKLTVDKKIFEEVCIYETHGGSKARNRAGSKEEEVINED